MKRLPASQLISAVFEPGSGILTITGDDLDNAIEVSRNAAGTLLVNLGDVAVTGGVATVANTTLIRVFGRANNDQLTLNEASGALPQTQMFGESGDDILTGGSGADILNGGPGSDTLLGKGGADFLSGGEDNDILTGGDADDQVYGELGNDRMVWNPGDDTDLNEGGDGTDTVEVNGGNGAEVFTATANGLRIRFDRIDPAPFSLDIGTCENLVLNANGGDDSFSATGNLAALIQITASGGAGNDTLLGSNGQDVLLGGDGDDFIDGQQGNDVAFLGTNNDTFQWDPGDGSDTVEGQDGIDRLLFNGSGAAENFDASANGARVRFTRNVGNIVMDLDDIETVDLNTLGGVDIATVQDLTGTGLTSFNIDLEGGLGTGAGDAAVDTVIVNGSNGADIVEVFGSGTSASVLGLAAQITVSASEGTNDTLVVNSLAGADGLTATTLPAGVVKLTFDGGAGNDSIQGSQGADMLFGGDGDDYVFGDNGNDVAFLGANNDQFRWDPGDGNDTIEGQDGIDQLLFFGSNASENIDIAANGGRVIFFRNVASVTMDLNDVENLEFRALAGADNIVAGDLAGTDVIEMTVDLRGFDGLGDAAADTVTINGTQGVDSFGASGGASGLKIAGLQATVIILSPEYANDRLTLNGHGGDDTVNCSGHSAGAMQLSINGGLGIDTLIGSAGDDIINGGDGNDTALLGAGNDTFVWNPGDDNDTVEGQSGTDTLMFNGANVTENINVSANGARVRFFRDVASVVTDLNDTEIVNYRALGGSDNIVMNDMAGTDLTTFNVDLASSIAGTGDSAADTITVNGSGSADLISLSANAGVVQVSGLTSILRISTPEVGLDRVIVNGLGGTDIFSTGAGVTSLIGVTLNQ